MQNNQIVIAVFGGTGFLGRNLIKKLTELDYRVKVATRNPHTKGYYLKPLGNPGYVELFKTNIFDPEEVKPVLEGCDFAINLCGILFETSKQKFSQVHAQFPNLLSKLCKEQKIKKLVHISSLGVKENHTSKYMESKLQGEKNIKDNFKPSIILRPGICFGPDEGTAGNNAFSDNSAQAVYIATEWGDCYEQFGCEEGYDECGICGGDGTSCDNNNCNYLIIIII